MTIIQPLRVPPTISVVMVSYHTGPALLDAVSAVIDDPDIFELILVDNGNPFAMRESLSKRFGEHTKVRCVQGHGNIGFGSGCNYGAFLSSGSHILFLNPDAIIERGSAQRLCKAGEGLGLPWIIGGILRDENGREQRGARRGPVTPLAALTTFTGLSKLSCIRGINRHHEPMPEGLTPMSTISGACFMMDRASFERLNGFDERYFLHVEDIDLCRRARLAGGSVYCLPSASALHYGSTSDARHFTVEREKLKSFNLYFWNYSNRPLARALCIAALPFLTLAILGRASMSALLSALLRLR